MSTTYTTTIAAIATPPGRGGVGIVRVSGPNASAIAEQILGFTPKPRYAHYAKFLDADSKVLDEGIALYFPAPHSFTGEDVFELQGHGGPMVLQLLLKRVYACGAQPASAGAFSERAFLNDKMDLAQAEAIADLINASSEQAARSAMRSLQGEFSKRCADLHQRMIDLRVYVEAAIDFPDEDIDFLADGQVQSQLESIISDNEALLKQAQQGVLLQQGMTAVIAGRPNAGKSSLLNRFAAKEAAIVTDIPGTTRDILREWIQLDGMPLHIIDTAGLRESDDVVEQQGIARALNEIEMADVILLVVDAKTPDENLVGNWPEEKLLIIRNKIDLTGEAPGLVSQSPLTVNISAKSGEGFDALTKVLKEKMGFEQPMEDAVTSRTRHLDAMKRALNALKAGYQHLTQSLAGEILAEELKCAHTAMGEVMGVVSSDDLLGEIFSSFCIGK